MATLKRWIASILEILDVVKSAFRTLFDLLGALLGRRGKPIKLRPWMLVRRRRGGRATTQLTASEEDIRRLLERMRDLNDIERLTQTAVSFTGSSQDFIGKPQFVSQLVERILREDPPFLHVGRVPQSGGQSGSLTARDTIFERNDRLLIKEPIELFIPEAAIAYRESRRPPGYPVFRAARSLSDLRAVNMLYLSLPEDLIFARLVEGSLPILAYREDRKQVLFRRESRVRTSEVQRITRVAVEAEGEPEGASERLVYLLMDRSTSLVHGGSPRGFHALIELAIAIAMLRSDMGRVSAKYYARTFADRLDPLATDPPWQASTAEEKDNLVTKLAATSFSGQATRIVDALTSAMDDIDMRLSEDTNLGVKPVIVLLTDGRSSLYGDIGSRLKRSNVRLDVVLIGREAAENRELMRIADTVCLVDPDSYHDVAVGNRTLIGGNIR